MCVWEHIDHKAEVKPTTRKDLAEAFDTLRPMLEETQDEIIKSLEVFDKFSSQKEHLRSKDIIDVIKDVRKILLKPE